MNKLRSFGIKNFRSFDEDGIYLNNIEKLNIFIGKNNSGKSTLLRFLKYFSKVFKEKKLMNFPSEIEEEHKRNGKSVIFRISLTHKELEFPEYINNIVENPFKIDYDIKRGQIVVSSQFDRLDIQQLNICVDNTRSHIMNYNPDQKRKQLLSQLEEKINRYINSEILKEFGDVIYIPHFRAVGMEPENNLFEINGSDIISKMFEMQHPGTGDDYKKEQFKKIQNFVKELLKVESFEIEIKHTKDEILINMHGNRLPLDSFGTGIHQLVILCSALVINENKIVCIEEPEVYLHPELQRMFLNFLIEETDNIYFISTHSNVFIDFNKDIQVNHVTYDANSTKITQIDESDEAKSVLDDLGYKNSDLLQSNGIIWVEGPSDRTYINKWISLLRPDLKEGLHYSIMFYGGKLLSHLTFSSKEYDKINSEFLENELIDLMKINQNSFVVIDRDGITTKAAINRTKKRIKDEIDDNLCWITKGREIENYLTLSSLDKWLKGKSSNAINIQYDLNDKIEDCIVKVNSKIKYNRKKSLYSKEIIEYIEVHDLDIPDLKYRINGLIKQVDKWNK